jgi:hypothetical protein
MGYVAWAEENKDKTKLSEKQSFTDMIPRVIIYSFQEYQHKRRSKRRT